MRVQHVSGVALLWDSDYHDGPVSGLAAYAGEEFWFAAVWDPSTDEWTSPRRYVLKALSRAEISDEWARHRVFERYVSTQGCHHLRPSERGLQPQDQMHRFYDAFPPGSQPDYDDRPAIGWFSLTDQ